MISFDEVSEADEEFFGNENVSVSEKNAESEEQEQQDQFDENLEGFDYNEMEELNDLEEEFSEDKAEARAKNAFEETLNEENISNDDIDTKKRVKTSKSEEIKRHKRKKAEKASHHSDRSFSPPHLPRTRSPTKSTERNRSQSSHSRASSSSSKRSSSTLSHSKDTKRSYTSESSDDEKKEKAPKLRDYGPDVSSWRMYEIEKEKAAQAASSFPLSSRGRNPNLVSTLRKPYVPGGGRKALAYFKAAARGRGRGRGTFLPGMRARGRGRGRGRGIMRFYGPLRPKSDYLDSSGKIDRKKLLEIATQNATKLAMDGKLPKGEELLEAIKTKSMEQLARRHESWKQRTEKRAKEREAEEAEEDSEKYIGVTKGGQPFKRSGPMLGFRDIKIKITPSQSGFSSTTISSTSTLPPPPPLPSIQKLLPNITDIGSSFPSSSESYMGGFTSKSSSSIFSDTTTAQRSNLHIPTQEFQQQQILQITSLFMDKPSTTSSVTSLASMLVPPPPIPPSLPPAPIPPFLLDKTKKTFEQFSSSSHSESFLTFIMDVDSSHADLPTEGHFSVSSKRRNLDEEMEDFDNSKKRRLPAGGDIGPKLVNMIKRLDQDLNGGTVETALEDLASVLESNLDPYEGQIIHILYECAAYLPEKITVFSTLVGLLNARSEAFGKALISKFLKELHNLFVKEEYEIFIRLVTFLCDLGNSRVLTQSSILDFLEDFIDNAGEESSKSDFFVYSVLHSLPWIGTTLNEDSPERFDLLLKRIDLYIGKRKKLHTSMLQVWSDQKVLQADYLDSLWMQIQKFSASNWLEKHILRIYVSFNNSLKDAIQHDLPCMDNSIITAGKNYPLPRVVFRLFSVSELPEDEPPLSSDDSIERFLVEEDLNWIIDNNYTDRKSCADALLGYYRKEAIPLNYMITEEIFYGSLLIELCRSQSNSMPQVLAMAAELLFQRVDSMQITCIDRFVDWFSFHLSNFEYRWSWSDWVECIEFDSLHPKRIFVREVIDRCLRLSYHKKLVELLPGEFGPVIPDEPVISYVLDDEGHPAFSKAEQFKELITQRAKDDEILALLIENNANEDEQMEDKNVYSEDSFAVFFAMMTVLVDKMIKMNILEPAIVQAWVFSEEMKIEFKRTWVWDVLTAAIIHLDRRRNKLTRDLNYSCGYLKRLEARNSEREQQKRNGNLAEGGNNEREEGETEENTNGVECGRAKEVSSELNSGDDAMDSTNINNEQNKRRREEGVGLLDLDELRIYYYLLDRFFILIIFQAKDKIDLIKNDIEQVDEVLRSVFLNICHKFTLILTEHLLNCETDGTDVETNFYNYVSGRFKYIFLKHDANMWKFSNDLEQELFSSPTIGPRIRQIFEQFVALRR
uniref:Nuclear cap-binding protein subunit 1 n=1 Tax=Meloidogyne javanica TaxID=6303 RepID=A0A915M2Z3_MELJA